MATDHNGDEYSTAAMQQMLAISAQFGFGDDAARWRRELAKNQARD